MLPIDEAVIVLDGNVTNELSHRLTADTDVERHVEDIQEHLLQRHAEPETLPTEPPADAQQGDDASDATTQALLPVSPAPEPSPTDAESKRSSPPAGRLTRSPIVRTERRGRSRASDRGRTPSTRDTNIERATKTAAPEPGDVLEYRFARMFFWQGSYVRAGIDLEKHFDPEPLTVTDLDLLAFSISPQLHLTKTIGEAKTGTSKSAPKPLDRAIWLAGLMRLVGADRAHLVTVLRPSNKVRETARALGVHAIHTDEIDRWEQAWLNEDISDAGSQGPTAYAEVRRTQRTCKGNAELERVFWFLRSEVWFLDPWQAVKRLLGAVRRLSPLWTPQLDDEAAAALRWLYAEAFSILSLNLVALTGAYQEASASDWPQQVRDRLSEGMVPAHQMRHLAESIDKYVVTVLAATNASDEWKVESMGAFHPTAPDWSDQLVDLIERLSTSPVLSDLPRYVDLVMHERLVKRRHVSDGALARVSDADTQMLGRDRRLFAAFLRACTDVPEQVTKALTA